MSQVSERGRKSGDCQGESQRDERADCEQRKTTYAENLAAEPRMQLHSQLVRFGRGEVRAEEHL